MLPRAAFAALLFFSAAPVVAAEPVADTCTAPADLGATALAAWADGDGDAAAVVDVGRPVTLMLENGAASGSLQITEAGRYGIAAGGKVWIDLVASGAAQTSVEHGHGPACSGIRKIVWFDLAAGTYELMVSKGEAARVRLLVVQAR